MSMRVLGISSSPRADGNSDLLLRHALEGAASAGAEVEYLGLRDLQMTGCEECNFCYQGGQCRIEDGFQGIIPGLLAADRLILATPVFFMAVSAQAKMMIDRCQCLWARQYVLKQPLFPGEQRDRRCLVLAVGGTRAKRMFDCITLTVKYWLDVLQVTHAASLFVNQVDNKGDIVRHALAWDEAFRLGAEVVTDSAAPARPVVVELFEGLGPGAGRADHPVPPAVT